MVIWEVLSGQVPFPQYDACAVVVKVSKGEHPDRPQGVGGRGSRMVSGGYWRVAGHPNGTTGRGSKMYSCAWRKVQGFGREPANDEFVRAEPL